MTEIHEIANRLDPDRWYSAYEIGLHFKPSISGNLAAAAMKNSELFEKRFHKHHSVLEYRVKSF